PALPCSTLLLFFFSSDAPFTELYTLSLHDALPICEQVEKNGAMIALQVDNRYHWLRVRELELSVRHLQRKKYEKELERERRAERSEEHTSELQSRFDLVCRLLLEKKKILIMDDN